MHTMTGFALVGPLRSSLGNFFCCCGSLQLCGCQTGKHVTPSGCGIANGRIGAPAMPIKTQRAQNAFASLGDSISPKGVNVFGNSRGAFCLYRISGGGHPSNKGTLSSLYLIVRIGPCLANSGPSMSNCCHLSFGSCNSKIPVSVLHGRRCGMRIRDISKLPTRAPRRTFGKGRALGYHVIP